MELCHCGQPLHYSDPALYELVKELIAEAGSPDIIVSVGNRSWSVPRHYIALHGLKAEEVHTLGFPEVL